MKAGKKAIAHHEAGHAVVARVLGIEVFYATLRPVPVVQTISALHRVRAKDGDLAAQVAAVEKEIRQMLAGCSAEQHYRPMTSGQVNKAVGWGQDLENASDHVARICYLRQTGKMVLSPDEHTRAQMCELAKSDEARALHRRLWEETETLVSDNWKAIKRVAAAMLERDMLREQDIDALIK